VILTWLRLPDERMNVGEGWAIYSLNNKIK
jgi:hypothetical protein